jgi:penicillin amidase
MERARNDLVRLQARRPSEWSWGHHHRLNLENQSVGQSDVGLVRWLFNRGGYEVGGGSSIVNATGWTAHQGFDVDWVPSMRMVVSMDDLDDSRWVNLTGVSGHPFNSHYVDQTELFVAGETLPWSFSRDQVEETTEDTLRLVPTGTE